MVGEGDGQAQTGRAGGNGRRADRGGDDALFAQQLRCGNDLFVFADYDGDGKLNSPITGGSRLIEKKRKATIPTSQLFSNTPYLARVCTTFSNSMVTSSTKLRSSCDNSFSLSK